MRLTPVMLALLLALSPGAVAMQASAPSAPVPAQTPDTVGTESDGNATDRNTTDVMTLGTDSDRTAFHSPSLALGSSLAMGHDGLRTQLSVNALNAQLEASNTAEKKKQTLNRYRYHIENRIISLKATERQATQAFSNGTISESEYLRTLGRIDAEADQIRKIIETMRVRADDISRFNLGTEADTLRGKLTTIEGPVRDRISAAVRGETAPRKVYVSTADTGIVLSTIDGDTYIRELVRKDNRDPSAPPNLSPIQAQNAVLDRYSWASEHLRGTNTFRYGSTSILSVSVTHQQGELVAYVDGGTEKVFKEVQYKQLTGNHALPPGPADVNSSENVTLAVNRTYPGGPLRVKLTNATGAPLQGRITVAGDSVGRTDPNGVLWTLGPSEEFRVSAIHEDTTVNVTTTPVEAS
ncbi:DUF7096 domain-containing protein [Halorussus lipolyticus]|uniref:DUF7096 domain-containing protein n=1 Tax=Halorussus lipolyticus TaxID=3034024 RepID=UPI0023E80629|nr:hypothetical protein [Halorussus sp. DT80]